MGGYMVNKLFTPLLTFVLVFPLSLPMLSQEGSKQEEAKETPAQEKAEKEKSAKPVRWEGMVIRSDKDNNTLTVRKRGSSTERIVYYDSSTEFTSQEHGSKKVNNIGANDVKDNDRLICVGHYDDKGKFHATLISKRLTP
jgi:hypothetical protein